MTLNSLEHVMIIDNLKNPLEKIVMFGKFLEIKK